MQLLAYILIYPILWLISNLPFRLLYIFSDGIYYLLYYVIGYRRKTVKQNLDLVFPNKSDKEKKIITKKFYHHLCDLVLESVKSMTISESEMRKRFAFTNIEVLQDLESKQRSTILMCAHYASWEWIFILQKYVKSEGYAVYKRLENDHFDKLARRIRARYNSYLITTKETIPTLENLKSKGVLTVSGFVSDQSPKLHNAYHWKEFMGVKVPVHTGAEMIGKKLDSSIVFFNVKKVKRGHYLTTFKTLAEYPREFKDYEITDEFLRRVEEQIHETPEYYLWTHKRWKHKDNVPKEFM